MPEHHDDPAAPDGDELEALRVLGGQLPDDKTVWEEPPPGLWERIAAEAAVPGGAQPVDDPWTSAPDAPVPIRRSGGAARRLPVTWLLGAAAILLVAVALAVLVNRPGDGTEVASAPLERLGATGSGEAELVDDDGELRLRVEVQDVDPGNGFVEVWVIDADVTKLVSLGPLRADGTYDLPPGLDPEQYPIVDVSVEPLDGDPTHSGDSRLRGQLEF